MTQKLKQILRSFFWVVPFIAFIMGYQFVRLLTHTDTIYVPSVIGLHLNDAIRMLSADQLNVRILAEKEDPDLDEGMILSQTPDYGQLVKPHQSIFLVISRKPIKPKAPQLLGLSCSQAQKKVRHAQLRLKEYPLESTFPKDRCIGQTVPAHREVTSGSLSIYCSTGSTPLRVFPNLRGKLVDDVQAFFGLYDISVRVQGQPTAPIKEQRPLAGSLIDMRKPLVVELTTTKKEARYS